uniref:CCD97-like C-terminal domain-containing protein n=1 Tax=Populus trichocarpa TaxID=3694 RepID=A0A3N7FT25_POPTR
MQQRGVEGERERGKEVRKEAMESMTERLSSLENLYFPRALQSHATNPSQRKSILLDLLSRDVAVFLERYGAQLNSEELREFDILNYDYEINWHLKNIRTKMSPTSEELKSRSVTVKNRRLAYLDKLVLDGKYFSEDAMREREPYLHHEFVGKFQDPSARGMARPGERWSETLMRRCEEAILVSKIREEQQRLGVDEMEWVGNERNQQQQEEEEEEEEEEHDVEEGNEEAKKVNGGVSSTEMSEDSKLAQSSKAEHDEAATLSAEEMGDMMGQFTYIMHQKFLAGEDHQHLDYSKIDDDETLDDHWLREANHDAEDKYFAEDEEDG